MQKKTRKIPELMEQVVEKRRRRKRFQSNPRILRDNAISTMPPSALNLIEVHG